MKKRSVPDAAKAEWKNNGSFMNKPKTGWIHSEDDIVRGITYQAIVSQSKYRTLHQNKTYSVNKFLATPKGMLSQMF